MRPTRTGKGEMVEYRVLGPLSVTDDGSEISVGGPRQRRLLTALLVSRNAVVSSDRLEEAVFDDSGYCIKLPIEVAGSINPREASVE